MGRWWVNLAGRGSRPKATARSTPDLAATGIVVVSITSTQLGATIAVNLFAHIGPAGAAFLRLGFAAVIVSALVRPSLRHRPARTWLLPVLFGLTLAAMNLTFYEGLDRVHLGIAVSLEFIGPLGIALIWSRSKRDLIWVALAGAGIALLAPWGGMQINGLGMLLVLLAGVLWGCYIDLSRRIGSAFPDWSGLALALIVAAASLAPIGIVTSGTRILNASTLGEGIAVAILSSVVTYSFELAALRRLPPPTFGVLMSLEPAIAALLGLALLGQALDARTAAAICCVAVASAGAAWFSTGAMGAPVG